MVLKNKPPELNLHNIMKKTDVVELRGLLRKARSVIRGLMYEVRRLRDLTKFRAEGNNGGHYVELRPTYDADGREIEGIVHLEIGESCVVVTSRNVSVVSLVGALAQAHDNGQLYELSHGEVCCE